jgi:predicted ArsR family transcriptional regulator
MNKHFYNTSNLRGKPLVKAEKNAMTQEEYMLMYLKLYKGMTASQAHQHFPQSIPVTSIRRALTRLKDAGKVEKTAKQITGPYGQPEFVYELAKPAEVKQLELF